MIPNKIETLLSEAINYLNSTVWEGSEGDLVKMDAYYNQTLKLINEARKENAKNNINPVAKFFGSIAWRGKS